MANLSDFISDQSISDLLFSQVKVGDVYRMHLGNDEKVIGKSPSDDGRNKYFIIIGFDDEGEAIGVVLLESEINKFLPQKRKDMHYPLKASVYSFLGGKDRYVDCSDLKVIKKKRFAELFSGEKAKGSLSAEDMSLIIGAITSYEDAQPKLLKRFGLIK